MIVAKLNTNGFDKRMKRFNREFPKFRNKLALEDQPAFFLIKLLDETIAGAPGTMPNAKRGDRTVVGVQTGNLRRSYVVTREGNFTVVTANLSVAPYAMPVAIRTFNKTGRDYLRTTLFFYGGEMRTKATQEWNRFINALNKGQSFTYKNPFGT